MGVKLTKRDVFALLDSDAEGKLEVTRKICVGYNAGLYTDEEIHVAEEIFRLLAKDAEQRIRSTLSAALKLSDDLPRDIALQLAKDVEEVSLPILEFSSVLTDTDLLEIIYTAEVQKLMAISRRIDLTGEVARGLVEREHEEVTDSILSNASFTSNRDEFEAFLDKVVDSEALIKRIINSATLPVAVSEKLLTEYSSQILKKIKNKYNITPLQFDKYVSHSLEISTLSVINSDSRNEEIDYLVNHLYNFGRLTAAMVLSAACMGRRRFFIASLAKRAGISKQNATTLIEKGGREGLYALLKKAGIPEKIFEAVELVVVLLNEKKAAEPKISVSEFCTWLISKLEYFAETKNTEYLSYMLAIAKQSRKANAA